ncbi:OstA-like protein [Catalinimonas alkaloidigena]|uniref:OstA-like protein n=2 Tax=Catalinimonas alkaloidigena TaxID=1075417 RepID=A0A1G8ZQG1_9BACT|nr:OstA-like protein [Catalinimonas alkaloidigena]
MLITVWVKAQSPVKTDTAVAKPTAKGELIEIINADEAQGGMIERNGQELQYMRLKGNVRFRHDKAVMSCDSAYRFVKTNTIEAFGHVRIKQGDSLTLAGDSLLYDGNTRLARMRGERVVLRDDQMTLTTQHLDFDRENRLAYYFGGGTIVDDENRLTSKQGYYHTDTEYMRFKDSVTLRGIDPPYQLESDTLEYSRVGKIAHFRAPTKIISEGRVLTAQEGDYNTVSRQSDFRGGAQVETDEYVLRGDTLVYDELTKVGRARRNVSITAKKDSLIIEGDRGYHDGNRGYSRVIGRALMKNAVEGDTLFIAADTMISLRPPKKPEIRKLLAYPNIRIYRSDLQGICDSLVYDLADSLLYFYDDPVLWSGESQLTADSVQVQMANNRIDRLYMRTNAFIISTDSLHNFNQIKGRNMTALFQEGDMRRVDVDGNGESIYFALEGDSLMIGMNKVICSNMQIRMAEKKVHEIVFIQQPDAVFIPPHELSEPDRRLKSFAWRVSERPAKNNVVRTSVQKPRKPASAPKVEDTMTSEVIKKEK